MIDALKVINANVDQLITLGVCMAVIGLLWYVMRPEDWEWLNSSPKRRGKMLKRERRKFVKTDATDGFVSYVEDQVINGSYTRGEANEIYRELKKCFPIRDLFPSTEALKENIRRRLVVLKQEGRMPLPGSKPKKKHMFDK